MVCIGEAIRHFPYSKHVLYCDEMNGLYYGISHTIYKLFKNVVLCKPKTGGKGRKSSERPETIRILSGI